jgi:hypothetical protein
VFEQPDGFESRDGNLTITIYPKGQAVFNTAWVTEGYISNDHPTWINNTFNKTTKQWHIHFVHETPDNPVSEEDKAKAGVVMFPQQGGENPKVGMTNVIKIALRQPHLLPIGNNKMPWAEVNGDELIADPDKKTVLLKTKDKEQEPMTASSKEIREEKLDDLVKLALNDKDAWEVAIQSDRNWLDEEYREDFHERLEWMNTSIRNVEKMMKADDEEYNE